MAEFDFGMGFGDGFSFGDLFSAGVESQEKKREEKSEKTEKKTSDKKTEKKASEKKAGKAGKNTDFEVTMPVTVLARGFKTELQDFGVRKMSEVFTTLDEMGFHEVRQPGVGAVYDANCSTVYITTPDVACDEEVGVDFSAGSIIINDGLLKCELSLENFDGYDADEVTVSELLDYWISVNPVYEGCRLSYAGNHAYPVFTRMLAKKDKVQFPCTFMVNGEEKTFDESEFSDTSAESVIKKLCGEPDGLTISLAANREKTHYFVCYSDPKRRTLKKEFSDVSHNSDAKAEKKYHLPLNVFLASFNLQETLTPENFDGAAKVTLEDIKKYYGTRYKIFSDTSRKLDSVYLEEENMLSLMFISGKKGACADSASKERFGSHELLRTLSEFREAIKRPFFQGTLVSREVKEAVRVENLPHGVFTAKVDSETGRLSDLKFDRKLPKIPMRVLVEVVEFFREDMTKEAWCKLIYDTEKEEYRILKGTQTASRTMVSYAIDNMSELYANGPGKILQVMEIHSHNRMPAFFSEIDDADEIYPGLFGVAGNIDHEIPSFRFRAGMEGIFKEIDGKELFTL